jgi:two-component system, chemotaxis family, CheB/CheR fusion protein
MVDDSKNTRELERRIATVEAQLSRAEYERKRWRAIFMELPACVSITRGPEHIFEFVNRTYELVAKTPNVIGKTLVETLPKLEAQRLLALTNQIYKAGTPTPNRELPIEVDQPDGSRTVHYFSGSIVPLKDESGNVEGLINFQFEVTHLVEAHKQQERFQERLALASEVGRIALWEWDASSGMVWKSENFFQVFGHSGPVEWSYETYLSQIHPEDRQRILELGLSNAEVDPNKPSAFEYEYRVIWPDDSIHWLKDSGKSFRDESGRWIRSIGATIDITSLKETELLFRKSKEAAEAANLAKTHFLANMSHELRTPLAAIIGFTELLSNPSLEPERHAAYTKTLTRNATILKRVIDDILDFSKIEAGHLDIEMSSFDLAALLEEVRETSQLEAKRKGISLIFSSIPNSKTLVETDRGRLQQILLNVLGNAIKFTQAGSVALEVKTPAGQLEFLIRDTGIGISPENQKKLFRPFTQADSSSSRSFGGTGLGLAISRRLARALGGDLTLEQSRVNQGSLFRISIASIHSDPEPIGRVGNPLD